MRGLAPPRRVRVIAKERNLTLTVGGRNSPTTEFATLSPDFASLYGGRRARWINDCNLVSFASADIATVLPPNVTNLAWPPLECSP